MRGTCRLGAVVAAAFVLLGGCASKSEGSSARSDEIGELLASDLGGDTTRTRLNNNPFGLPVTGLTASERARFEVGDSFFTQNWVTAPASTDKRDGLGPTFNTTACASCHVQDGRGAPPDVTDGDPGLLLRVSRAGEGDHGGPNPDPEYGDQIQSDAIEGVPAEGTPQVSYEDVTGEFADGETYTLQKPTYTIVDPLGGTESVKGLAISPRTAPAMVGMGLLAAIPSSDIEAAADPSDDNGDGVSGRANWVFDSKLGKMVTGRFGWKANVGSVDHQVGGAFLGDMGITSPLFPNQNCPASQTACAAAVDGGRPEIDPKLFDDVVFYTNTLAVPGARDAASPAVKRGAEMFAEAKCSACHTPTQHTGESDIDVLADQTIHPYTDLLLHDMGSGLADGRSDFAATGTEWRTPPLWGIGLIEDVNGHDRLLHDGRARGVLEAILWHGGEAEAAKDAVIGMSSKDRAALVAFVESR